MVVTRSRLHAVRYKQAFDRYIAKKGYADLKTLVAFSGTVTDPEVADNQYTEASINGISESELPAPFCHSRLSTTDRRRKIPDRI